MGIFSFKKKPIQPAGTLYGVTNTAAMAELAINAIQDGVILVDASGLIKMANPAAVRLAGTNDIGNILGLDCAAVFKLGTETGGAVPNEQNPLTLAIKKSEPFSSRDYSLLSKNGERQMAISLTVIPTDGAHSDKIVVIRDITQELEDEDERTGFISTASHEMRTPVASIEGYLGLALNPATATIDERARQYLVAAHQASQHLGHLFKDLLDVTKLDDKRAKLHLVPMEMRGLTKQIADAHTREMAAKQLRYIFGTTTGVTNRHQLGQMIYSMVDVDAMREILDNLIENAIKYTPEGGEIRVNVYGDGNQSVVSVTDTGIGIGPEDLSHIFQKFYRVDNSQTRTIGGTGLGLYLVKMRAEAMGGRVWAESNLGEGTTFYVALPRLSAEEYERRRIAVDNERVVAGFAETPVVMAPTQPMTAAPANSATVAPAAAAPAASVASAAQPEGPVISIPIAHQSTISNNNPNGGQQ